MNVDNKLLALLPNLAHLEHSNPYAPAADAIESELKLICLWLEGFGN